MKKAITILSICLLGIAYNAHAQQKKWKKVVHLLAEEAEYFRGKNNVFFVGFSLR